MYASDYGYAVSDECTQNLLSYDNATCKNNNWLFKGVLYRTISPNSSSANSVCGVDGGGSLNSGGVVYRGSVRPSVYLKSDIKIVSGSGTKDDMFKLG